jgi:hypothetical protein
MFGQFTRTTCDYCKGRLSEYITKTDPETLNGGSAFHIEFQRGTSTLSYKIGYFYHL